MIVLVVPAPASAHTAPAVSWPARGQASYRVDGGPIHASPAQHPVPIASTAKVMTALLTLKRYPIRFGEAGFRLTMRQRDVDDMRMRANRGESYVPVRAGGRWTESQLLAALLLPSANNIAIVLA